MLIVGFSKNYSKCKRNIFYGMVISSGISLFYGKSCLLVKAKLKVLRLLCNSEFTKAFVLRFPFLVLGAIHMRWWARWAGSPRLDDFYPTFIWNRLSQFNQSLLCRWKNIVWSSIADNKQWGKAIMQNKCSYIISLTSEKKLIKENSILPCRASPLERVHKENIHLT